MPTLTNPDDPTEYMQALGPIMITGTTVGNASWFVEKGVDSATAQFPVLILMCPQTEQALLTIQNGFQATFDVRGLYLDRWECADRTLEQGLADAKEAVYRMARNIRATPDLGLTSSGGQSHIVTANRRILIRLSNGAKDTGLGFPVLSAEVQIQVVGPWFIPA